MSQKTLRRIWLIYGLVLSALILALGVCFMVSCVSIYRTGASPFSPTSIGEAFARFAPLAYLTVAVLAGSIVLALLLPGEHTRPKAQRDSMTTLAGLYARADIASCDPAYGDALRRLSGVRRIIGWVPVGVSVLAAIPPLWWCLNPAHFQDPGAISTDLNGDIIAAAGLIIPCALIALGMWLAMLYSRSALISREIAILKQVIADTAKARAAEKHQTGTVPVGGKPSADASNKTIRKDHGGRRRSSAVLWSVRGVILAVGIVFVILGVLNGGMADVLGKAVRICTECIGLG